MDHAAESSRQPLDAELLRASLLSPAGPWNRVECLTQVDSSNTVLAQESSQSPQEWPDLSVLTAEVQRQGKGRLDRSWVAPQGSALAISLLLRPTEFGVESFGWLSMISAVAVCQLLEEVAGLKAVIKWPNDVLILDQSGRAKKVCGILAQLVTLPGAHPAVVLGTGINVSQEAQELPTETSTSVLLSGGAELDRNVLLTEYARNFASLYKRYAAVAGHALLRTEAGDASMAEEVTSRLLSLGQQVRAELPGGKFLIGTATGIDAQGALLITDAQGSSTAVSAADVVHLRKSEGSYA
ncbi:BirA family biotin operon repressor/biotin-[acetyl-CoA-carboxylase] ligase [Psychromicrobium silvestre]|uniref:biotin--[biotin carboxyl-carrier protein] ligase n=1 Tax=Psychromicrobium silvestre TaxID=1645614 RepID=A0A7Y9S9U5_9MICC|nr:biotin--[acetyl-CoA-carboxylase] ligase [Psychromicrobium silvestre]NYE96607.1 BirA family biotin operon repressor/biotin-[acetyl-CoA-carboxylase] ligase [Psychromicrobium silvestre]